jgi:hypothetical protein
MTDLFSSYKRFGIFGASESGKSTLAKKIVVTLHQREGREALVLDPLAKDNWGSHAPVWTDEAAFWAEIFRQKGKVVVVDDASATINRDRELNKVFTALRHQNHKLVVIGHDASNLLPQMRAQLQRVFLFLQNRKSVEEWEVVFPGKDLTPATQLQQYEFLTVANYQPLQTFKLSK